jgi:hypothetical protein
LKLGLGFWSVLVAHYYGLMAFAALSISSSLEPMGIGPTRFLIPHGPSARTAPNFPSSRIHCHQPRAAMPRRAVAARVPLLSPRIRRTPSAPLARPATMATGDTTVKSPIPTSPVGGRTRAPPVTARRTTVVRTRLLWRQFTGRSIPTTAPRPLRRPW